MAQQEALKRFPDIGKSEHASNFLYTCLTPEVREKLSLEHCATALSEDPTLHEKLKDAHRSQNLEALENLCVHVKQIAWRFHPDLGKMNELIRSIAFDGSLASIARGESERHFWKPASDDAHADTTVHHESLHIPANRRLVYRAVSEVLLARFLVFRIYQDICSKQGFCLEQRQRWLELQIFPMNIIPLYDLFGLIKSEIADACLSDEELDEAMLNLADEIQSTWEMPAGDFFYIVVDEANVASRMHEEAFEDQCGRYPILKEIIRSLRRRMGSLPVKFIVSGTIIPEEHFQSNVGEWDDFHWCSDTGSFDDREEHCRYVTKFLPPKFATSVPGQALLDRMWQWLRGRPHTLLGNYIENITEYLPHDNDTYSEGEEGRYNDWYLPLGHKGFGLYAFRIIGLPAALPEVKLVTFTKIEQRFEAVDVRLREDIYGKLVFMADSNEDILSWFKHERDEPFCALLSSSSNTVILAFCLQRADEQSFWVFVRISSKSTNEEDIDFAQEIDDLHPTKVFHDQPDILSLLSNLPNLCLEVGDFGVLRISGSSWAENASEDSIPPERRPAGVLNIDGLDEAEKGVPYEEFMRRLSQAIVQTKKKVETALPPPVVEDSKKGKKRGRSSTVLEDSATTPTVARTRKTKSVRSTRADVSDHRAASTRRTKSLKSTNVNVTTGSDNKPGRSNDRQVTGRILRSRRSLGRISDVAPGRVSTVVTRPDRVEPIASTSSSTPYNLRKR
ncbi:hypothetical protein HHX47_DHR8000440 [Lentinula edodes]|nr:hypothetical protein HHX47_DHR8000440 [Lentinula edodes]